MGGVTMRSRLVVIAVAWTLLGAAWVSCGGGTAGATTVLVAVVEVAEGEVEPAQLRLVVYRDGVREVLVERTHLLSGPQWSPDGRYLAYLEERDGTGSLTLRVRERGGETVELDYGGGLIAWLSWSSDDILAVVTDRIRFFKGDGSLHGESAPLSKPEEGVFSFAGSAWSPNGTYISIWLNGQLYVVAADGGMVDTNPPEEVVGPAPRQLVPTAWKAEDTLVVADQQRPLFEDGSVFEVEIRGRQAEWQPSSFAAIEDLLRPPPAELEDAAGEEFGPGRALETADGAGWVALVHRRGQATDFGVGDQRMFVYYDGELREIRLEAPIMRPTSGTFAVVVKE
jgi:hypothetical protein